MLNIVPEAARYIGSRNISEIARLSVFNNRPDALCVSGLTAGVETDTQVLSRVREAVPETRILCNTGWRVDNVERQLSVAGGWRDLQD
nr:BtpA/SgcQ family protein [Citreicella sp. C3M06]